MFVFVLVQLAPDTVDLTICHFLLASLSSGEKLCIREYSTFYDFIVVGSTVEQIHPGIKPEPELIAQLLQINQKPGLKRIMR